MRNISWCPCLNTRLNLHISVNCAERAIVPVLILNVFRWKPLSSIYYDMDNDFDHWSLVLSLGNMDSRKHVVDNAIMYSVYDSGQWLGYRFDSTGCCKTTGKLWQHITETLYGVFLVFLGSYDCQIWAIFHFGTLWA